MRAAFISNVLWTVLSAASIAVHADSTPRADVTVTGAGVGISQMNGGTVQMGLSREEVAALVKATGDDLVRQLTRLLERNSAQQGWVYRQSVAIGVVDAFLANVEGRVIPQDEWPAEFAKLTAQLQQARVRPTTASLTSATVLFVDGRRIDGVDEKGLYQYELPPFAKVYVY